MTPKGELSRPGQRQMVEQRRQAGSQVGVVPVVVVAVGQAARRSRPGPQQVVEHRRRAGSQVEEVPVVVAVAVVQAGGRAARPDEVRWETPPPSGFVACGSRQRKISAGPVLRSHGPPPEGGNFWK